MNSNLIPTGWHQVHDGSVEFGDKYWDASRLAWLPITVNDGRAVEIFLAVIRKDGVR